MKTVVITGSARGFGYAMIEEFYKKGFNVVLCDINYEELKNANADLILVALGSPKQEYFIYKAKNVLPPCLMVGIGGSLDVWSGMVKRAPKIYQKLGLEWLYRTVTQPERFKRIFPTLPLFLIKSVLYKEDK